MTAPTPRGTTELRSLWQGSAGDYVSAVQIAKRGQFAVIGAGNGRVLGLDLELGRERFSLRAHDGAVLGVSIAPDGATFATCGQDASARVWTASGEAQYTLPPGEASWVEHVAWAPAGGWLAVAGGRRVRVYGRDGRQVRQYGPLESAVSGLAWRADGSGLAACSYGGVHLWPFVEGAQPRHLAWRGSLISLAWSPDGRVIACGSQDRSVHFWRLATGVDSEMSGYALKPRALGWDRESRLLATAGDAVITVWDFRGKGPEGTRPQQLAAHSGPCTCVAFSSTNGTLASGSQDTSVLLWEPRKGDRPVGYAFMEEEVTALAWHPEQRALLGADASGALSYWRLP